MTGVGPGVKTAGPDSCVSEQERLQWDRTGTDILVLSNALGQLQLCHQ